MRNTQEHCKYNSIQETSKKTMSMLAINMVRSQAAVLVEVSVQKLCIVSVPLYFTELSIFDVT